MLKTIGFPCFFEVREPPRGSQLGPLAPKLCHFEPILRWSWAGLGNFEVVLGDFDVVLSGLSGFGGFGRFGVILRWFWVILKRFWVGLGDFGWGIARDGS